MRHCAVAIRATNKPWANPRSKIVVKRRKNNKYCYYHFRNIKNTGIISSIKAPQDIKRFTSTLWLSFGFWIYIFQKIRHITTMFFYMLPTCKNLWFPSLYPTSKNEPNEAEQKPLKNNIQQLKVKNAACTHICMHLCSSSQWEQTLVKQRQQQQESYAVYIKNRQSITFNNTWGKHIPSFLKCN